MFFGEYVQASKPVICYPNCDLVRPGSIPVVDDPVF